MEAINKNELAVQIEINRAVEITQLHSEVHGLLENSLKKAIRIGQLLVEQKVSLQHGRFGDWIENNLPFTLRTAQNYMKIYRNKEELKNETVSHLSQGYRLLRGTNETAKPVSLFEQRRELTERQIRLERAAGKAIIEINELFRSCKSIGGTAKPNIVFHIERDVLTVFKLAKKVGQGLAEKKYKDSDLCWLFDKHVCIGKVTAIWDRNWSRESWEEHALSLYDRLMSSYDRLCDVGRQLMGIDAYKNTSETVRIPRETA